jgi:thiol-disulfide isomerase/thioredoxin
VPPTEPTEPTEQPEPPAPEPVVRAGRTTVTPPPSRRAYLVIAVALVLASVGAVLLAAHTSPSKIQPAVDTQHLPVGPVAPAVNAPGWTNSAPLTPASLQGKVVLYDFWTYSCVNCVRTFPYVRAWYDRYRNDGLVIIGIHSPEFDFEKNHDNVIRAVKNLDVTWPVAFDDKMVIWDAFNNNSWPADYIADRTGHVRYTHVGEGDYAQSEDVIRTLLGVASVSPRAGQSGGPTTTATTPSPQSPDLTPETYLGVLRGNDATQGPATYPDPGSALGSIPVDTAQLVGPWTGTAEYVQADAAAGAIVLHYQAREVNLVLAPPATGPVTIDIELDGHPLPPAYRTAQTVVDPTGRTTVVVANADMYRLVLGPAVEGHVLRITAGAPGLQAYSFTFGA